MGGVCTRERYEGGGIYGGVCTRERYEGGGIYGGGMYEGEV